MEKKNEITEQREIRALVTELKLEKRAEGEGESRKITGYGAVFEKWSEPMYWFKEKIARGAFDDCDMSDCILCFNHDDDDIMARTSSGTLQLSVDDTGLKFEAELPNTTCGNDLLELIRRGDINACSFAFTVEEDAWMYSEDDNNLDERTILKVKRLYDVCPVVHPAYKDTSCDVRSLEVRKEEWLKKNRPSDAKAQSESRDRQFQMLGLMR